MALRDGQQSRAGIRRLPLSASGDAELGDMSVAAWDGTGSLLFSDAEGPRLPFRPDATGFVEIGTSGDQVAGLLPWLFGDRRQRCGRRSDPANAMN